MTNATTRISYLAQSEGQSSRYLYGGLQLARREQRCLACGDAEVYRRGGVERKGFGLGARGNFGFGWSWNQWRKSHAENSLTPSTAGTMPAEVWYSTRRSRTDRIGSLRSMAGACASI